MKLLCVPLLSANYNPMNEINFQVDSRIGVQMICWKIKRINFHLKYYNDYCLESTVL